MHFNSGVLMFRNKAKELDAVSIQNANIGYKTIFLVEELVSGDVVIVIELLKIS